MEWLLATMLKGFIALVLFVPVLVVSRLIYRYMPDSKFKRILFSPLPGHKDRRWN